MLEPVDPISPEDRCRFQECRELLAVCLAALPDRQALLMRMRYREELTLQEIADLFGVQKPAVHAMHVRAVAALRASLMGRGVNSRADIL